MWRTLCRRFLVLAALIFWQGGFIFYASIVVPISQQVLDSHLRQGLITRRVTDSLNLAGIVALLPLAWDAAFSAGSNSIRRLRWWSWLGMALALGVLLWLHRLMDGLIDPQAPFLSDRHLFRVQHRAYLWISTAQWGCSVLYSILALYSWRLEDRGATIFAPIDSTPLPSRECTPRVRAGDSG